MEHIAVRSDPVLDIELLPGDKRPAVYLGSRLADHGKPWPERRRDLAPVLTVLPLLLHKPHGKVEVLVSRIADEHAGKEALHVFPAGLRPDLQQICEHEGHRRRVVCALHHAGSNHRLLHVIRLAAIKQPLGCHDLGTFRAYERDEVGVPQDAVEDDRIGSRESLCIIAVPDGCAAGAVEDIPEPLITVSPEDGIPAIKRASDFHRAS